MATSNTSDQRSALDVRVRSSVVGLALIVLVPLVVVGAINLHQFQQVYRAKVDNELLGMIERHSLIVDSFINDRLSDVRVVAREHPLDRLSEPAFLSRVLNLLREEYHGAFVDLGLVTEDGVQIAYSGPFNLSMVDYSSAEWFPGAITQESFISDVFAGLRGSPHFIITTQKSIDGKLYLLKATIDFEAFNALVENIRIGDTGFAFIINQEGEFQTSPHLEVALNRPPYIDVLEGRMRSDRIFVVDGEDNLDRRSIFTFAPLKQGRWLLCYQQEIADALEEVRDMTRPAVIALLLVSVVALVISALLSKRLATQLAQADHDRAVMTHQVIETGRLASIGELAAGIAHEINNPVAIMVQEAGWIDDLLHDEDPTSTENLEEIERAVGQIRTQGDRCKEITYKLLSFARKTDPSVREVIFNDIVEEVIGLTSQKTRYSNVNIATDLEPGLPAIQASPTEIQQVLLNLVNNAIDAIDQPEGTVTVTTRTDQGNVVLEVRDTGNGIPEANLARIFDPFFTTKPVGQGTGLGLSICYGIVEKAGGSITVESEVGQGTSFAVSFPIEQPGPAATTETESE
ncbi:MAG: ATP-binding protein [Thermoanaerobaculales bacterium]|jgi:two-component system NtrC family sensor kinase|nr:ATP-binding protein [Thermoanaerobaculales bacterium]